MPVFNIQFSNQVEKLRDQLLAAMEQPLADPLAPEYVLVDNAVMGQWLNLQLAQEKGIAANIRYIQPHELFWTLARAIVSPQIPAVTPLSKEEMTWKLFGLSGDANLLATDEMAAVRHYLAGDDNHDLKRYQLAAAVADLFDQYLIYRPQWMLDWEKGKSVRQNDANERWQQVLWCQLVATAGDVAAGLHHRASIEQQLLSRLTDSDSSAVRQNIPLQRLFVFGIASMPPRLIQMLQLLGNHVDVSLLVMNPCGEFWSLISSARTIARQDSSDPVDHYHEIGNPLLASQAVQVRDFISLLQEYTDDQAALFDTTTQPQHLLQAIQQEIRDLHYKGEPARVEYVTAGKKQPLPGGDGNTASSIPSVHVHSCHSVMREVEVLHDQLRDILQRHPEIQPRDIVVMMPRVAPYVASIHAVFNSVPEKSRLEYHITDRSQLEESPLLNSLATLLQLPQSRLPLSEVVSLLEVPAIQRRFGMDQDAYETVKHWLVESGVRWGVDAQHRTALGLPAYAEASWAFGFDRLLSGYAMMVDNTCAADILALDEGLPVLPYDEVEGGNSRCLDALLQFWQTLQYWRDNLQKPASARSWAERLRNLVDDCFAAEDEAELAALQAIDSAIRALDSVAQQQWFTGDIALPVVRALVQPVLQQPAGGHHHWREGVKFCSLMPMRGVPFKVVYVLGMNLDDYPRRVERRSFDLMRNDYRPGDRASRVDDRWLFLEAMLSARRYFHVSYIGRDMHRNEKREPSVVLAELMDYCRHGYDLPADYLLTEHPLQPFGEAYFRQDRRGLSARLLSFNTEAWQIAAARQQQSQPDVVANLRWHSAVLPATGAEVSLEDFIRFFTKPWDWFFTRKHRVWLDVEDDAVSDDENFGDGSRSALDDWQHCRDLIAMANAQPAYPADRVAQRDALIAGLAELRTAEGRWPLGKAGVAKQEKLRSIAEDYLWASHGKQVMPCKMQWQIGQGKQTVTITGELPLTADGELLLHSASKLGADKRLDLDIRLALARKQSPRDNAWTTGLAVFRDKTLRVPVEAINEEQNDEFLALLAGLYCQYRQTGLPLELSLSEKLAKETDADERAVLIDTAWYENTEWHTGITADIRKRSYFGSLDSLRSETFLAVSRSFFGGLHAWRDPVDHYVAEQAKVKGKKS